MNLTGLPLTLVLLLSPSTNPQETQFLDDICGHINGQRIYLDHGEAGTLEAKFHSNIIDRFVKSKLSQKRCTVEFISCPSCIVNIKFRFLNLSRNCDRSTVFDACGCDYVWIYEPTFEQSSEQFCGRFVSSNVSVLEYKSQTRKAVVEFLYNRDYQHAFTLDYFSERNKILLTGFPKFGNLNSTSQAINTPFFPNLYPADLTMEHMITCESTNETCRISLVFTDFLIAASSIIDFFDWNGERIYVTTGSIFRPPVIVTSGPALTIRFYANGATNLGFRAYYSFILGNGTGGELTPDIDCGGQVGNLGGAITMMDMVHEGLKSFDCIWLIKPPETYLHMKTHLYVKVFSFSGFAGSAELVIRQGLTSYGPIVENLKLSLVRFYPSTVREHIVPISQGFYVRLKGFFRPESRLAIVYAAFNYKQCLAGSDFLCHNQRCISTLLNCDGFDHCGDNSDEFTTSCSNDPRDRRQWSKTPHFLFPKIEAFSELATSTVVFLLCSFGFIGFIFAMIVLLYRVNIKTRQQRQIQDHIETINAILEENVGIVEEEIIIPDDPPDYEAPPDYEDVMKRLSKRNSKRFERETRKFEVQGTSGSCQTTPVGIPDSPPPAYDANKRDYKIFTSFHGMSFRNSNFLCDNLLSTAGRLMYRRNKAKFFSDSELSRVSSCKDTKMVHYRKSLTTEDVNLFI
ncbi:neuropilin and tolloid-like protein 1 isoform X1 [Zophobas morio]|uniref:neuropilin and tolloid-like protein 1 isoform X1 n=1 Tax=Zophobas morio TaxID=2755281 RepID=UPI003082E0FF